MAGPTRAGKARVRRAKLKIKELVKQGAAMGRRGGRAAPVNLPGFSTSTLRTIERYAPRYQMRTAAKNILKHR